MTTYVPYLVYLNTRDTAGLLCLELGHTVKQWMTWLANERRPSCVNITLPPKPMPANPVYCLGNVDAFMRSRYLTANIHASAGKPHATTLHTPAPHVSPAAITKGTPAQVRVVMENPQKSYDLASGQASNLIRRLQQAVDVIDALNLCACEECEANA